jgi:hypothetical protein
LVAALGEERRRLTPKEFVELCDKIDGFTGLDDRKDIRRDEIGETPALDVFGTKILKDVT